MPALVSIEVKISYAIQQYKTNERNIAPITAPLRKRIYKQ